MSKNKPIIGILGGIGSGKSTVAAAFAGLGCAVIDADALAHEVLGRPEVISAVKGRFGSGVLDAAGAVDRRRLAQAVFETGEDIGFLNELIHPAVIEKCEALMADYQGSDAVSGIVLDMPLLLEAGWEKKCDFLVFVDCEEAKRLERSVKKGKKDASQLKKREKYQISLDKKKEIAHYSIYNNSEVSDVTEQVAQIFSCITK